MAKIPEAFGMAQYSWSVVAEVNSGNFIQLNSNITHQVRMILTVQNPIKMAVAASAASATNTSIQSYIRASTSGTDYEFCGTPSSLWIRADGASTSQIYAFGWTLENADLA